MLYILRLTNGSCVVVMASDEESARQATLALNLDEKAEIATVRALNNFAIQVTPSEDGSLQVDHWDDATLDEVLPSEYPLLDQAIRRANAQPFVKPAGSNALSLGSLHAWHERNNEVVREAVRQERGRLARHDPTEATTGSKPGSAAKEIDQKVALNRPLRSKAVRVGSRSERP
jgi:hypothetical protein